MDRPLTVLLCALGGEGGGVLSQWLFDTALACGHSAQSTSIPGVAQRTGATTYYVEIFPRPDSELAGRRPVFSLNPVPGGIDLLVSSELLETVRQVGLGMASAERTVLLASSARALTVMEKVQLGDGRVDDTMLLAAIAQHARRAEVFDMSAMARQAGTVISAVMFGAVAASGVLPLPRAACEETICRGGFGVEASLRGFALGFDAVAQAPARAQAQRDALAAAAAVAEQVIAQAKRQEATTPAVQNTTPTAAPTMLPAGVAARFPAALHERLALGHARLVEYQGADYAALYLQRLQRVLAAEREGVAAALPERAATASTAGTAADTTHEASRWLALWMAFDDIVRVAELKLRTSRTARVRREVAARDDEIVKVFEHFKPGVAEFAALLPSSLANRLLAWDKRRQAAGREPWTLPLKVGSHTVFGAVALRLLGSLKGQRRRGSRFALEQQLIERWLAAVEQGAREHPPLGLEIARCGRLVKGYGSTNERGKNNLLHIVDHLAVAAEFDSPSLRAEAIAKAREAALADEGGAALDRLLMDHGAPKRAAPEQTIRWHKRKPAAIISSTVSRR